MTPEQTRPLRPSWHMSADAKVDTPHPEPTVNAYEVVRGEPGMGTHHDPRPCPIPPDESGGDRSIDAIPSGEDGAAAG